MVYLVGADPVQLDALGIKMTVAADRLESIRTGIGALLAHSHWEGRDADDFRHLWHHQLAPRLHNAAVTTRAGATTVRANAQQQRDASGVGAAGDRALFQNPSAGGAHPLEPLFDAKDRFDPVLTALGGLGFLASSLSDIAAGKIPLLKAVAPALHKWPAGLQNFVVRDLTESSGLVKAVGVGGELAGAALNGALLGLDVVELAYRLATDPDGAQTYNTGVEVLLGIAGVVAIGCPPALLIVGGASLAFSVATAINPNLTKDIVHGVGGAFEAAWGGAGDLVKLHGQAAEVVVGAAGDVAQAAIGAAADRINDAADMANDVISGGLNSVKNLFS